MTQQIIQPGLWRGVIFQTSALAAQMIGKEAVDALDTITFVRHKDVKRISLYCSSPTKSHILM